MEFVTPAVITFQSDELDNLCYIKYAKYSLVTRVTDTYQCAPRRTFLLMMEGFQ